MARVYLVSEPEMRALFARLSAAALREPCAEAAGVCRRLRAEASTWAREIGFEQPCTNIALLSEVAAARFRPRAAAREDDDFGAAAPCDTEGARR